MVECIYQIVITISYLLLLQIFWSLGTKIKTDEENEALVEVEVEDFDEEAETNARIWNQLVRQGSPEANEFRIEGSVASSHSAAVSSTKRKTLAANIDSSINS